MIEGKESRLCASGILKVLGTSSETAREEVDEEFDRSEGAGLLFENLREGFLDSCRSKEFECDLKKANGATTLCGILVVGVEAAKVWRGTIDRGTPI